MATDLEMSTVIKGKCVTFNKNLNMSKLLEILEDRKLPRKYQYFVATDLEMSTVIKDLTNSKYE